MIDTQPFTTTPPHDSSSLYLLFFPDNCLLCQCVYASKVATDTLVSVRPIANPSPLQLLPFLFSLSWWQSARDIKLILENRRPFPNPNRAQPQYVTPLDAGSVTASMFTHHDHLDVRAASQRPYLTPSSSGISLPRNPIAAAAVPAVPVQSMEMTALSCSANANASPKSKAEEPKHKEAETEA